MTKDIKNILVPIDFGGSSARALEYAQMLAHRFGASMHVVHVCEVPSLATASMDAYAIAYTGWSQQLGEEAERELTKVVSGLDGISPTTEVLFGNPARCIVTAATTNHSDLIVMGTHGHGPILHMVMGNVAERVVRTAPCPVLTVRESGAAKFATAPVETVRAAVLVTMALVGLLLSPIAVTRAEAQTTPEQTATEMRQRVTGGEVFRTYCATCHGPAGRGDGPLATSMRRKPADLTEIAKRNGGQFPTDMVFRTIDGRQPVRGHGGPDMPVWGDAFARSRDGGDANSIRETIESLVRYVESLQVKPVH